MLSTITDQRTITENARKLEQKTEVTFESVSTNPYELSYACLLIPRFSTHYLIGDLADNLHIWMGQICVSFDWRLDFISVQPDYLQWIIRVPPAVPPARIISIVRHQTSREIFENFPRFKRENRSTDFWAHGYLVIVSTSPHPSKMVKDFIRLTREQQGYFIDRG
jgi:REP element-mobilizing transposase RayT